MKKPITKLPAIDVANLQQVVGGTAEDVPDPADATKQKGQDSLRLQRM